MCLLRSRFIFRSVFPRRESIFFCYCLEKGNNLRLAYVQYIQEGKKSKWKANTMTYTVALPFSTTGVGGSNRQTTTTIVRSRLTTTTAVTVQHFTGSDFFRTTFSSHSATDKGTEI